MEVAELLPGEVGDVLGVAARDERVGEAGEQRRPDRALHGRLRRRQGSLHLVEHDALVTETAFGVVGNLVLVADSLLLEGILGQGGKEGRVQVHV